MLFSPGVGSVVGQLVMHIAWEDGIARGVTTAFLFSTCMQCLSRIPRAMGVLKMLH